MLGRVLADGLRLMVFLRIEAISLDDLLLMWLTVYLHVEVIVHLLPMADLLILNRTPNMKLYLTLLPVTIEEGLLSFKL